MDSSSPEAAKHALGNVSPGAAGKGRETTPPEGSGSSNTHKRRSLSDSPRSDSDPKPKTSKGKAKEVTPEDREGNVPSSSIQGGPEQVTRKRRHSLTNSPRSDDPKPKRSKGKAKAKEASPEDREGNVPPSSIQGGPEQVTRKRPRSLADSPSSDDPKPKRLKGKAKAKEASPEDREGNVPSSSIQGEVGSESDAEDMDVAWGLIELRHFVSVP